jgi:hypothetical protein
MLSFLFATVVRRLFGCGSGRNLSPLVRPNFRPIPPQVEALEDRCLLSALTTVPSTIDVLNPYTVPLDMFVAAQPKGNPNVVFLGDSIAAGYAYGSGIPVWSAFLAPLGAVDYGVGNQTTQTLLYQLSLGQLVGINPSAVVLIIGTNNLIEGDSPSATAAGVLADVNAIHHYLPAAEVLVLGVPPLASRPNDPSRQLANQTDALINQMLVGEPQTAFINIAPGLEQPDGTVSPFVVFDNIHPTTLGYLGMTAFLLGPLDQAWLEGTFRTQMSLVDGLFGEVALSFQFSSRASANVSSGLRALIL